MLIKRNISLKTTITVPESNPFYAQVVVEEDRTWSEYLRVGQLIVSLYHVIMLNIQTYYKQTLPVGEDGEKCLLLPRLKCCF